MSTVHSFPGGTHPHEGRGGKAVTAGLPIVEAPQPSRVAIPLQQHIGAPCKPLVSKGDTVKVGQMIGEPAGVMSAAVHASISGTVVDCQPCILANGTQQMCVIIDNDFQDEWVALTPTANPESMSVQELSDLARRMGIVGLGGATFPTAVKLNVPAGKKVDTLVLNGAECEPYLSADHRLMLEHAEQIVSGARIVQKVLGIERVMIGIEDNKPDCIEKMKAAAANDEHVEVRALPCMYPQGGEKVLIYHTTGKIMPEGKLPIDVGSVVMNVTSVATLAHYCTTGMPLVEKCITVDGSAIKEPKNVIAPIGTACKEVIDFAGGFGCEPKKLVMGGPMMGVAQYDLDAPVAKGTSAILAFNEKDARPVTPTACIRCGGCIDHCPMNLMPVEIERAYEKNDAEALKALKVGLCIECGCCAFQCPAHRPLVQVNKLSKTLVRDYDNRMKTLKEAGK